MSDSMQKILDEMRSTNKGDVVISPLVQNWADRIEALMREPVGVIATRNYQSHGVAAIGNTVHNWVEPPGEKYAMLFNHELPNSTPLFAAPPDTQALIDAAREECARIAEVYDTGEPREDSDWAAHGLAKRIRSRVGQPLEKKP